jgi:hypothetical protein
MKRPARMTLVVDGYSRLVLTLIAALMVVLVLSLWAGGPQLATGAFAAPKDVPAPDSMDPGAQRLAALAAAEGTNVRLDKVNEKLDRLVKLLESGKAHVVVVADEGKGGADAPK